LPIHPASGIIAKHETTKSAVGFSSPGINLSAIAIGTNIKSQSSDGFNHEDEEVLFAIISGLKEFLRRLQL
jgi:hypothetical protein